MHTISIWKTYDRLVMDLAPVEVGQIQLIEQVVSMMPFWPMVSVLAKLISPTKILQKA